MEHCHHKTYDSLGDEPLSDLEGLCGDCHAFVHGKATYDPAHTPTLVEMKAIINQLRYL